MFERNKKGQFLKGHKINLGKKCSKKTKNKISNANKISLKKFYKNNKKDRIKNNKKYIIIKKCLTCNKKFEVYKKVVEEDNGKYCCRKCFEKRQISKKVRIKIRNTLRNGKYIKCKICNKDLYVNQSGLKNGKKYCSSICQYKDKISLRKQGIISILKQLNKKGLNKLELRGRKILQDLEIDFNEQVLMFDKFLVDILLKDKKTIIQWDGEYWHTMKKNRIRDKSQDAYLKKCGYNVIRITDKQIKNNIQEVYNQIIQSL